MNEDCPNAGELAALLDASATVPERLESHIADCADCQQRLDRLSASEAVVSDFVAEMEPPGPDLATTPELQTAIENAKTRGFDFTASSGDTGDDKPPDLEFLDPPEFPEQLGQLANFAILELIAEGGMGLVFRARDPELQREVAIKVLSPQLAADTEARDMFLSEARAAASLDHENILPIHLVETSREIPFLVMPLIRGGTLHDRLRGREPLDFESEILPIALASARALAKAHGAGLIHRDVKPANLMLETDDDGARRIWLADFGLARAVQESAGDLEKPSTLAGTPHFLAPELIRGEPASEKTDLFALGAVFYAMAAGRLPFSGKTSTAVLAAIRETEPEPIDTSESGIPSWFASLTAQLLTKDPANRIDSAEAVVAHLEAHIENRKAAAIRAALLRNFRRIAAVLVVATAVLAGTVAALDLSGRTSLVNAVQARTTGDPFGIRGHWGVYGSLSDAIEAAPENATVEIFHDGRLALPETQIRGKSLTLEPASSFAPVLVNEGDNNRLLSVEDARLTLRDLTFLQNISSGLKVFPVLRARRARLIVERFAFIRPGAPKTRNNPTGIRRPEFVELIDCPEAVFRDGYATARLATFVHVSNESSIPGQRIRLENCFIGGSQVAIFMGNPRITASATLSLDRCTLIQRVPFLVTRNFGPLPVKIDVNRSVVVVREAFLWAPLREPATLPGLVELRGEGNVFRVPDQRFISLNNPALNTAVITEGTPAAFSDFRAIWELPEGFARLIDEVAPIGALLPILSGSRSPTEGIEFSEGSGLPDPTVGADLRNLGPATSRASSQVQSNSKN